MSRCTVLALGLATASPAAGCELVDAFAPEPTSLIQVMVTHHGTPENGEFPDRTTSLEGNREFDNDEGWTVTLTRAYVVTADVELRQCSGEPVPLRQYWGPLPEDLGEEDLDLFTYGGTPIEQATLCGATVTYGPYRPTEETARNYTMPDDMRLDGLTFYLRGYAVRGEELVEFELSSSEPIVSDVDFVGGPVRVTGEEAFPVELTLSKTYDRFFDGIDFATSSQEDLVANVLAVLGVETFAVEGTELMP